MRPNATARFEVGLAMVEEILGTVLVSHLARGGSTVEIKDVCSPGESYDEPRVRLGH